MDYGTLLGLTQVVLIPIPFVFYKYGDKIRARSPLIKQMRADQERSQKRAQRAKRRQEKLAGGGAAPDGGEQGDVEKDVVMQAAEVGAEGKK